MAATGFYRPSTEADKKGSVQYNIETGQWRQVNVTGQALRERLLAAAVYDRENDVAIVTGGIKKCAVEDFLPPNLGGNGQACRPTQFPTLVLSFDDQGDITVAAGPSGGPTNLIGHTMDCDPTNKRVLVHGGSTDGMKGINTTWVLGTSDLSTAAWSRLGSGGP